MGPTITPMPHTAMAALALARVDVEQDRLRQRHQRGAEDALQQPRATICVSVSDRPHSAEATVKPAMAMPSRRLTPSRSDSQPVSGVAIAAATI